MYRYDPKFSDSQVEANSIDPDQTAPQGLHCLPLCLHRLGILFYEKSIFVKFLNNYSNFWVSEFLGVLRYMAELKKKKGPCSSVGRVSAPGNGRSRVRHNQSR